MKSKYAVVGGGVRKYKPFQGQIMQEVPPILADDRTLIDPMDLVMQRLHGRKEDRAFLQGPVDTYCALISNPRSFEMKLVLGASLVSTLNSETQLREGALPLTQEYYQQQEGLTLPDAVVGAFLHRSYALPKKREEVLEFLTQGRVKLAQAYKDDVCQRLKRPFSYVLGLNFSATKGLRLVRLWTVGGLYYWSLADGYYGILGDLGRLVGVAPEAHVAKNLDLEARTA